MSDINRRVMLQVLGIGISILMISIFFYRLCIVNGDSMLPTMQDGDIVLMKNYNLQLERNDIIVIKKDNNTIIKRLIGKPGDSIVLEDYVYVNGEQFDNIYTKSGDINSQIELIQNEYFVLGDNRDDSIDSRFDDIGIIKGEEIIGKIIYY